MAGTIRFQALVDRSGRPDVYTPWSDPLKDSAFQKARKQNRVLTIHQNLQGAKDFGEVGFQQGRGLQYLLFPKSLAWAEGKRVVGIHYEEVADAKFPLTPAAAVAGAAAKAKAKAKTKTKSKKGAAAVKARAEKAEVAEKSAERGETKTVVEPKRGEEREERKAEEAVPEEREADALKPEELKAEELKAEELKSDELKSEERKPEELKSEEPVKLDLDPLTVQLKSVLNSLEKKHVVKAKALLKKMLAERVGAKG